MKKTFLAMAILGSLSAQAMSESVVNVYSQRQDYLITPILEKFTAETGIKTNVLFIKDGIADRLEKEGTQSPADVVLTVDIKRLTQLKDKGLAQAVVGNAVLDKNIPAIDRDKDGDWYGLTLRARAIFTSKDRVGKLPASFTYYDLAKPELKGKVCVRSGKHAYNVGLVASMIAHDGIEKAREFLLGLKANLARKPQGGDRDQIKAIAAGQCDYALGNSYYFGIMLQDPKQKPAADEVYINFPNQTTTGTHMNISGVALTKYAPHKAQAIKLMEYLSGASAQEAYADKNNEYPVMPGVPLSPIVASWGNFKKDSLSLDDIAANYKAATKLIDEVQFDLP